MKTRQSRNARYSARMPRRGFTLVEVLVATAITLSMMALTVTIFAIIANTVANTRATIQMVDRVREARLRMSADLAAITAVYGPTVSPDSAGGYLEYIEGPVFNPFRNPTGGMPPASVSISAAVAALNNDEGGVGDSTAGDFDDVLMMTIRTPDTFSGRALDPITGAATSVESNVAEVCWFVRGNTLYRRVLLVMPGLDIFRPTTGDPAGYYHHYDVSARQVGGLLDRTNLGSLTGTTGSVSIKANSLGDLTKRENRFGHQPYVFPHDVRFWGLLRLPTMRETSALWTAAPNGMWPLPQVEAVSPNVGWGILPGNATLFQSPAYPTDPNAQLIQPNGVPLNAQGQTQLTPNGLGFDLWSNPNAWLEVDPATGSLAQYAPPPIGVADLDNRYAEDVLLNNVLMFDVKAWDPLAPVLADGNGTLFQPGDPDYLETYRQWVLNLRPNLAPGNPTPALVRRGAYVDLNYLDGFDDPILTGNPNRESHFSGPGFNASIPFSPAAPVLPMTYDTWSDHYERDGIDQDLDGLADEGTNNLDDDGDGLIDEVGGRPNGLDDDNDGVVDENDELDEQEAPAPYPYPIRGMQIKVRTFDPTSRQIREFTVVQDTLPQ